MFRVATVQGFAEGTEGRVGTAFGRFVERKTFTCGILQCRRGNLNLLMEGLLTRRIVTCPESQRGTFLRRKRGTLEAAFVLYVKTHCVAIPHNHVASFNIGKTTCTCRRPYMDE